MSVVSTAATVPGPVLPREDLIGRHLSRPGQSDEGVDCHIQPRPVPVVAIGVDPQCAIIRLHIAPQVWVLGPVEWIITPWGP